MTNSHKTNISTTAAHVWLGGEQCTHTVYPVLLSRTLSLYDQDKDEEWGSEDKHKDDLVSKNKDEDL